jgi:hypothetical protein
MIAAGKGIAKRINCKILGNKKNKWLVMIDKSSRITYSRVWFGWFMYFTIFKTKGFYSWA